MATASNAPQDSSWSTISACQTRTRQASHRRLLLLLLPLRRGQGLLPGRARACRRAGGLLLLWFFWFDRFDKIWFWFWFWFFFWFFFFLLRTLLFFLFFLLRTLLFFLLFPLFLLFLLLLLLLLLLLVLPFLCLLCLLLVVLPGRAVRDGGAAAAVGAGALLQPGHGAAGAGQL
jgi:hypothetical protein